MSDLLPIVWPDSPRARRTDPLSSHEAADATAPHMWESQQATLAILQMWGMPLTSIQIEEIAAARGVAFSPQRLRSALPELEEKGLVERDGFVKRPSDRTKRQLWKLKERDD